MNADAIARTLRDYQVDASPALCRAVEGYLELLLNWNRKLNLTAVTDPEEIVGRHFGESLFAVTALPVRPRGLVDVGSGAGFPGLAMKLMLPETQLTLIEANAKKAAFLNEVVHRLELDGVNVMRARIEEMDMAAAIADCVTARAVGSFARLLAWSMRALEPNGKIILWLGAEDASRLIESVGWSWENPVPIPRSKKRVLLIGSPARWPFPVSRGTE